MKQIGPIAVLAAGAFLVGYGILAAQEAAEIAIKDRFDVRAADAKSEAIVAAADRFLAALSDEQREAAVSAFDDNAQRSNWSNLPVGMSWRNDVRGLPDG